MIKVSVYYSPIEGKIESETVLLQTTNTVLFVIQRSELFKRYPEILQTTQIANYSQAVSLDAPVFGGERIEICRPLELDPKAARRLRAQKKN